MFYFRSKITELDDCSILNDSETSFTEDEEELIQVCKKWADHQTLDPVCDGLKERIVQDQFMLQKVCCSIEIDSFFGKTVFLFP